MFHENLCKTLLSKYKLKKKTKRKILCQVFLTISLNCYVNSLIICLKLSHNQHVVLIVGSSLSPPLRKQNFTRSIPGNVTKQ